MKLNWRHWMSLANQESVRKVQGLPQSQSPRPIPKKYRPKKELRNPHRDGPHSLN